MLTEEVTICTAIDLKEEPAQNKSKQTRILDTYTNRHTYIHSIHNKICIYSNMFKLMSILFGHYILKDKIMLRSS